HHRGEGLFRLDGREAGACMGRAGRAAAVPAAPRPPVRVVADHPRGDEPAGSGDAGADPAGGAFGHLRDPGSVDARRRSEHLQKRRRVAEGGVAGRDGADQGHPDDDDAENPRADVKQFPAATPEPHLASLNAYAKMFARATSLPDTAVAITDLSNPTSAEAYDASQYE